MFDSKLVLSIKVWPYLTWPDLTIFLGPTPKFTLSFVTPRSFFWKQFSLFARTKHWSHSSRLVSKSELVTSLTGRINIIFNWHNFLDNCFCFYFCLCWNWLANLVKETLSCQTEHRLIISFLKIVFKISDRELEKCQPTTIFLIIFTPAKGKKTEKTWPISSWKFETNKKN